MKKYLLLFFIGLSINLMLKAQNNKIINVTAGSLYELIRSEANTITSLTLTGTIDARDFKTMRDIMPILSEIDLGGVTVAAYFGSEGTHSSTQYLQNAIPASAFYNKNALKKIILPSTANDIQQYAFYGCNNLTSVNIPSSVTVIGVFAFYGCTSLTTLFLPSSIWIIGERAFNCGPITVDDNNQKFSTIDGVLFNKNKTILLQYPVTNNENYIIPSSVNIISSSAFAERNVLKSVTIPTSVEYIESNAFNGCTGLTSLIIPNSVFSIRFFAFYGCTRLTSVTIPSKIGYVESGVFSGCTSLNSIYSYHLTPLNLNNAADFFSQVDKNKCKLYVPYGTKGLYSEANQWKDFTNVEEMPGFLLSATQVEVEGTENSTTTVDIESSVAWTVSSGFSWLTMSPSNGTGMGQKLTIVASGNPLSTARHGIITISSTNIQSQKITVKQNRQQQLPKTLQVTPGSLFAALTVTERNTITHLTLTGTIDARDFKTFRDEMPLLAVLDISQVNIAEYNGSGGPDIWWFTNYSANKIPVSSFVDGHLTGKTSLTSILLPSSLTAIGAYAFYNCSGLTSIVIPPLVSQIDGNAFYNCTNLKIVDISSTLTNLGYHIFHGCSSLTSVSIPSSVTSIGESCFSYCYNLSSVLIPSSVKWIGRTAFMDCKSLTLINLPTSIDSIGQGAFNNCTGLKSVNIPPLITTIGNWFTNCSSLGTITIPSTVRIIGGGAFEGCNSLTSIRVPSSVESIGENAFESCTGLTSVTIGSSVTNIGNYAFKNCSKLATLTVEAYIPPVISLSAQYVFSNVDRNSCILNVPYGTTSLYATANQWKDFSHIVVPVYDLYISSDRTTVASQSGSIATIEITTKAEWTASSDQNWLVVSPASGTGNKTLTFTAEANASLGVRKATVTVSSLGLEPKTITVTQNGSHAILNISPGSLASVLTPEEMKIVTTLTITGNIDARDFKTIRDNMPKLAILDLENVNIVAYNGIEGTTNGNKNYTANTIPEFAFYNGVTGKTSLVSIVFPTSVTAIGQRALSFCSGLKSIKVDWPIPIDLTYIDNIFNGWDKNACILYVPYGTASRYSIASQWKDFTHITEATHGFNLSSYSATITFAEGSTSTVNLYANVDWTTSSDQSWLTVTPVSDNGDQLLKFTANENTLYNNRTAIITFSASGVPSQTFTITQNIQPQPIKTLALTAGKLSTFLTPEVLNTISVLTLTGTIDARDFKTMRDKMPVLGELDLSGANIVAYNGGEGTSLWGNHVYAANAIPETAFYSRDPWTGNYYGKTSLTSVILPNSLISLGNNAFTECNEITNIVIPPSVTTISNSAFYNCKGLTSVSIPSSITSIGNEAFSSCQSLTTVSIPLSVTSIGASAFRECKSLTSLILPSSVKSIGSYAFIYCDKLNSITASWYIPLNLSSSYAVFEGIDRNTCTLTVPYGTSSLYSAANQWKEFTHVVEMPGFHLSATKTAIEFAEGSTSTIVINSDVEWTATSDQPWLSVSPASGSGMEQKLTFTAAANPLFINRTAIVTVSATGVESQMIAIVQSPEKIEIIAGGLSSVFTDEELKTIHELTIKGTIDARDFKTMRDKMPLLAKLDLSEATITAYKGSEGTNLWISTDYPANKIPEYAFYRNTLTPSLRSIIFPPSITAIGRSAFYQCSGLTDISIPPMVITIEAEAFVYCTGLKTLYLPSSVISLGTQCFRNCSNLTSITANGSIPPDLSLHHDVFYQVDKSLCILNVPYLSAVDYRNAYQWRDFQNIVEADNGFHVSSNNVKVEGTVGSTATVDINSNIGWTASADQNWLVVNPATGDGLSQVLTFTADANPSFINPRTAYVTISAPGGIFQDIVVTQSVHPQPPKTWEATAGGLAAAYTDEELATIYDLTLTGTIDARDFKTMRDKMPLLREIDLGGATIVAYNGTEGTSQMGNTDYPPNTIPEHAFVQKVYSLQGKGNLASIVLPESLTAIGQYSFYGCFGLTELIIPQSVTEIGSYAYFNCSQLRKFTIPSAVTNIGTMALGRLLCEITVDPENQYYSGSAIGLFNKQKTQFIQSFYANSGSYDIPSTVTSIGDYAFYLCPKLSSVFIPSSVTSIGKYAFSNGSGLTTITIPSSVTYIGELAFAWRYGLKTIYVNSMTPVNLESSPSVFLQFHFYNCTLYVPTGSKNAYQTANQWKDFPYIVEINPYLIANAGEDQIISEGTLGSLNGSALANTNGKPLTYQWTAPEGITLSSDTESNPTFIAPEVTMDQDFTFSLIISDGDNFSTADQILIKVRNTVKAPVAKAGADQSVNENSLVTLDGSTSVDPNGYFLYYEWFAPFSISLSSSYSSKTTFQAPEVTADTDFSIYLRVTNGYYYTTDTVVITVKQVNQIPVANAGNMQIKSEGEIVTLDGTHSMDADGDALTYLWTAPEGITLNSNTSATPSFTVSGLEADTYFIFKLVVNDGKSNSAVSEAKVLVRNIPAILNLSAKVDSQTTPINLNYKLFMKEGDSFIHKRDTFAVTGETLHLLLEPGDWMALVAPARDPSAFIPTYVGNVVDWNEAEIISITAQSITFREITCIMPEIANAGSGQISGFVYEKPGSGTTSVSMSKTLKLLDKPFPDALVLLYRMGGTIPVASSFTDSEGAYQFDKLELSDYEIVIELPGFIQSDKFTITLSEKEPEANAYFGVDTSTKVITDNHSVQLAMIKISPNPTLGEIHISGLQANLKNKISIYSIAGNLVLEKTIHSTNDTIDISHLISGTYLFVINKRTFKIIKK